MQAKILTVTDAQNAFAEEACEALMKQGIRAEVDTRNEKLGFKVREAQLAKIPYILVVGDKEVEARSVNVRLRTEKICSRWTKWRPWCRKTARNRSNVEG